MTIKLILSAIVLVYMVYWLYLNFIVRTKDGYRSVVLRFGKFHSILGPGVAIKIPAVDRIILLDLTKEAPNWRGLSEAELKDMIYKRVDEMLG